MMKSCHLLLGLMFCLSATANGQSPQDANGATVEVKSRSGLLEAVGSAKPGTTILLAPGVYEGGLHFKDIKGEAGKPIVIGALDPQRPPVIEGGSGIQLTDPAYLELRDLVIAQSRGNGLNIDDGGTYETPAHHVKLLRLVVRDIGSDANHDGLKLSGLDDFSIEKCTVERWGKRGSGIDMVGCHRGTVHGCVIREGDAVNANGVQMKGGSSGIAVRYCRFENAGGRSVNIGGSTGLPYFRPKPQGYEAKDITVEDCTFLGSMAPIAFVGVDGATVQHNTFYRPTRWVLRILQENQDAQFEPCRKGRFVHNIVVFQSAAIASIANIGKGTSPESFEFAGNVWHCEDRPDRTQRMVQLPSAEKTGTYGQDPQFKNAAKGDFALQTGSPAQGIGPREKK